MMYSTYLATCWQLDVPRCLMLYYQYVSVTFSVISVWNHSQTSPQLSRFQLSEARFITSINIIRLSSHKPPFTRSLTICWDPNWPRSLLSAFKILLLIEDSHQELISSVLFWSVVHLPLFRRLRYIWQMHIPTGRGRAGRKWKCNRH